MLFYSANGSYYSEFDMKIGNIVIALHGPISCNSGKHVLGLAREISMQFSINLRICVPAKTDMCLNIISNSGIVISTFEEYYLVCKKEPPDCVHIWTPRQLMMDFYSNICKISNTKIPYIIHLEDNEELLICSQMKLPSADYIKCKNLEIDLQVPKHLMHPHHGTQFLFNANGITALVSDLLEFCSDKTPSVVFWPGYDETIQWETHSKRSYLIGLGIVDYDYITVYTGNVHASNVDEVRSLYLAIALLNRRGVNIKLIRTGVNYVPLSDLGGHLLLEHTVDLGYIDGCDLPKLLAAADILIQPGINDSWNRYRVPSKIPEYLASGRALVLPACNIGNILKNNYEAIVLSAANAENIVRSLEVWLPQKNALAKIGQNGKLFAELNLQWRFAASKVFDLYMQILGRPSIYI